MCMSLAPGLQLLLLVVALVLAVVRRPCPVREGAHTRHIKAFLIGISCQCFHFLQEFVTDLLLYFPPLFGVVCLSAELFVGFNPFWFGIWVLSVFGPLRSSRVTYFPIWFFALAMCLNGLVHPLLALLVAGYFPGLVTSPVVGMMGVVVTIRLFQLTDSRLEDASEALK